MSEPHKDILIDFSRVTTYTTTHKRTIHSTIRDVAKAHKAEIKTIKLDVTVLGTVICVRFTGPCSSSKFGDSLFKALFVRFNNKQIKGTR